ncbi:MAG: class I SAM-dependent methyltransferase [Phenylobacterium sp.]|uniref:class I SAM-dependent methyltransferase n=1 Tax=Phenylobacterium sp. TaxID=1871053 RepID=UPI00391B470F
MAASGLYGAPPRELAEPAVDAVQCSPLIPGAAAIEDLADGGLDAFVVYAPPGAVERRYVLAQALRALRPGGRIEALAPKDRGGSRLKRELEAFGCAPAETARRHHRICLAVRPEAPEGLAAAIAEGGPRLHPGLGLWTQPGVFSWDRIDAGSALLLQRLPRLAGRGADLGAGLGVLAHAILASEQVTSLTLVELDRRAVEAARRNVDDPRAAVLWADVRNLRLQDLDFVVMNPPFHDGGREDRALGQAFIAAAAAALRKGGVCWLVANRHLPYEAALAEAFAAVRLVAETGGFKVYEARR